MASDFFIKFDDFGDASSHKLETDFLKFGHDFFQAGDALGDLLVDFKVDEHKPSHGDIVIVKQIDVASAAFVNLGFDTNNLDDIVHKFDDAILKFADQTINPGAASDGGGQLNLSDDFIKLDTDFHAASLEAIKLGLDTLKLTVGGEGTNDAFIKWAGDISDFSAGLHKVGDDFLKVGEDFIKLGNLSDSDTIDQAFIKLGGGALKVGDDLHKVSDDFLKIVTDITGSGDNVGTLKIDEVVLKFGDDFHKLDSDLHKLSVDVVSLGNEYIKLADVLPDSGRAGPSDAASGLDSVHQVLQHMHDFSLL